MVKVRLNIDALKVCAQIKGYFIRGFGRIQVNRKLLVLCHDDDTHTITPSRRVDLYGRKFLPALSLKSNRSLVLIRSYFRNLIA